MCNLASEEVKFFETFVQMTMAFVFSHIMQLCVVLFVCTFVLNSARLSLNMTKKWFCKIKGDKETEWSKTFKIILLKLQDVLSKKYASYMALQSNFSKVTSNLLSLYAYADGCCDCEHISLDFCRMKITGKSIEKKNKEIKKQFSYILKYNLNNMHNTNVLLPLYTLSWRRT